MQERMQEAQAEVQNIEVIGESGGGMVKVISSGRRQVKTRADRAVGGGRRSRDAGED